MDVTATVTCPDTDAAKSVELSAVGEPISSSPSLYRFDLLPLFSLSSSSSSCEAQNRAF